MATTARDEMGKTTIQAVADRGYFNSIEIKACTEAGITPLVPKPMTSNAGLRVAHNFAAFDGPLEAPAAS